MDLKLKKTGRAKRTVRKVEISGESEVQMEHFRLTLDKYGVFISQAEYGRMSPGVVAPLCRHEDTTALVHCALLEALQIVESFNKDAAIAELKEAIRYSQRIADLLLSK